MLLASQLVLLALAFAFTPSLVELMAPGFQADPEKFALAVRMTRITFPYLMFITLVTLHSGTLNAHGRFAAAAFAPVLLNVAIVGFLSVAFLFPNAGEAASWGVVVSGAAQLAFSSPSRRAGADCWRRWRGRVCSADVRQFFRALLPAIIGSAGVQIAIFADTIIASLLPTGIVSSIYYAERLYQLPIGVIGVAAGTVLLPEMSRRLARGDEAGAALAQNRTMAITLALSAPFCVAFLQIPELVTRGAFLRGAFTAEAAAEFGRGARRLWARDCCRSCSFARRWRASSRAATRRRRCSFRSARSPSMSRSNWRSTKPMARSAWRWRRRPAHGSISAVLYCWRAAAAWMRPNAALAEVFAAAFCASGLLALAIALQPRRRFSLTPRASLICATRRSLFSARSAACVYGAALLAGLKLLGVSFRRARRLKPRL